MENCAPDGWDIGFLNGLHLAEALFKEKLGLG